MHEPSKEELKTLETELAQAMLQNDVAALERLLSDEVIFTAPHGAVIDKVQDLALHQSDDLMVTTYETDDVIIRVYDSTAITNLKVKVAGLFKGECFFGTYRYTRTYLKKNGQ
jgi:uncharacterized protein Smg (DUF494 family)